MLATIIADNMNEIKTLCKKHKVKALYIFGSAVSDRFNDESDVDLLYKFDKEGIKDYFINFFEFKENFERIIKRDVDLVPYENLKNNYFIESVEKSKVKLYES